MKINNFNEWDPKRNNLAQLMSAVLTWETKSKIPKKILKKQKNFLKAYQWLLDEVNEDLDAVKQIFEKKGIKVFRPKVLTKTQYILLHTVGVQRVITFTILEICI